MKNKLFTMINLRLFDNTQTTLLNAAGNSLSAEMKTYYHDRLIDNAEPNLVYDQFGAKYPIPKNGGKTIEFRKYDPLPKALDKLTEGVAPHGNKLNVSTVTATVDQYGDYIEVSDVLELTAIDRNIEEATKLLGAQAGRTLDTVTRDVITGGSNKIFAPKVSGATETQVLLRSDVDTTANLTPKVIRKAVAKLKQMNAVPIDDSFVAVIHPDVACDLLGNSEWIESHKYAAPENIYRGEIGKIAGVRFVESTEAKIIAPSPICGVLPNRTTVQAAASSGATAVKPNFAIAAADATAINTAITAGAAYKIYVGGVEMAVEEVTGGAVGTAAFKVAALAANVAKDATLCGTGAGKDGSAIYCTMIFGANAYGVTEVTGGGLQHIVKPLGSGGTSDPLDQIATTGWKALKVAERLVEAYMIRVEHSSGEFGASAESN